MSVKSQFNVMPHSFGDVVLVAGCPTHWTNLTTRTNSQMNASVAPNTLIN